MFEHEDYNDYRYDLSEELQLIDGPRPEPWEDAYWCCEHGYSDFGAECPNCGVPAYWPEVPVVFEVEVFA